MELDELLEDLDSAESFLQAFNVEYEADVIKHNRVQLLRLFRQNLDWLDREPTWDDYQSSLSKAYCLLQRGEVVELNANPCGECKKDCG